MENFDRWGWAKANKPGKCDDRICENWQREIYVEKFSCIVKKTITPGCQNILSYSFPFRILMP